MNIGQAIKLCRTQRALTPANLASQVGCTKGYIYMLEKNMRRPTASMLAKIAHALRIPVGVIFFLTVESGELKGINKSLLGELALNVLKLFNEQFAPE